MRRKIEFTIPLAPVAWQRVKRGEYGQAYVPTKTRRFKNEIALYVTRLVPAEHRLFFGPLRLTARFILIPPKSCRRPYPSVRPDLDNYLKALKDGLIGVLWDDDSQVCMYGEGTGKFYDMSGGGSRIEIIVEELE